MGVHFKENEEKISMKMIITGVIIIGILVASLIIYLMNANTSNVEDGIIEQERIGEEAKDEDFESVSIDIGKTVNEAENELNKTDIEESKENNAVSENKTKSTSSKVTSTNTMNTTNITDSTSTQENKTEKTEEVKFDSPIKGEILREFAPDSLVYSDTLEEWITHNGIDIKADKTAVVTSAAKGTVFAIKNDPRYGVTVIVSHDGGYQTVYANLLTAEFVVEGEEIEAGQTIGTVGNTATFEIADDYHLHFELIRDGEYLNPCNYMEF